MTKKDLTDEQVRLIDENGVQIGVLTMFKAFYMAIDKKMDLALVSETTTPKVARIVDYGKIKYEQKKNKKNQKNNIVKIKEIKFGLNVGENDYKIKVNKIIELLNDNFKVKTYLVLKGREMAHKDMAFGFMNKLIEDLKEYGNTEDKLSLVGRNIIITFARNLKNE